MHKFMIASFTLCMLTMNVFAVTTTPSSSHYEQLPLLMLSHQASQGNAVRSIPLTKRQHTQLAKIWGLTVAEFQRYLYYMHNTPDVYSYSPTSNPNWILAAHETNPVLYRKYIRNSVIEEHDENARMLRVNRDFTRMAKQLYPHELPIMLPAMRAARQHHLQRGDVVQVYCHINSAGCHNVVSLLLARVRAITGVKLDIFALGTIKKKHLIAFAKRQGITPQAVQRKRVTLNLGDSAFAILRQHYHHTLALPFISVRRQGQQIIVNLVMRGAQHG